MSFLLSFTSHAPCLVLFYTKVITDDGKTVLRAEFTAMKEELDREWEIYGLREHLVEV